MNGAEPVAGPSRTPSPPIPNGKSTLKLPAVDGSPRPSTERSFDLPSLQPLSHDHPLLSAPTFDADTFLLSRIYIPLEELRAELREYLAVLREELVQLINDDYEEFISLGIGLRGEGDRLRELQEPLKVLEEEAELVRDNLKVHQDAIQEKLEERSLLREEKTLLDMLQRLFDTLGRAESLLDNDEEDRLKSVVRAAGEYTQLIYLLGKASSEGCKVVQLVIPRVEGIKSRLHVELSALLLDAMNDTSSFTKLKTVLKIYDQVEGWNEASDVVRNAFRTFCASTITSTALLVPPTPGVPDTPLTPVTPMISVMQYELHEQAEKLSDDSALASIYNAVLLQVESYGSLMSISEDLSQNFDVFAGVLWPEIAQAIMDNLGSVIFAAGRPDELHQVSLIDPSDKDRCPNPLGRTTQSHTTLSHVSRISLPQHSQYHRRDHPQSPKHLNGAGNSQSTFSSVGKLSSLHSRLHWLHRALRQALGLSVNPQQCPKPCQLVSPTMFSCTSSRIGSGGSPYKCVLMSLRVDEADRVDRVAV